MSKAKSVIVYYVLCNKLKEEIRTGWKDWNVRAERLESVAEHVYSVQMLAIAMYSEYDTYIHLDIRKVLLMLAIHELGETIIGDLTQFQISKEEKEKIEHEAVHKILNNLVKGEELESLFLEFDSKSTPEALFAYQCDKLECDLQCKMYDEKRFVDLNNQPGNSTMHDNQVKALLDENCSWSEMWLKFGQEKYSYDPNFMEVSNYALKNQITK